MNYFKKLIRSRSGESSKRFVTIIISFHFILASFLILLMIGFLLFWTKTIVNLEIFKGVIQLLATILEWDFYIILSGFGFIAVENVGQAIVEKAKVLASSLPMINVENAETVSNKTTQAENVKTDNIETVNTNTVTNTGETLGDPPLDKIS